jgi:mono/diheme cytochrome c family protein
MLPHLQRTKVSLRIVGFVVVFCLVACGGGEAAPEADAAGGGVATVAAMPTMPAARFTAVAQTSQLVTQTAAVTQTTTVTQPQTAAPSAEILARGAITYAKNKCADCHGAQGEGVADKGQAIAGTPHTLEEFDTVLRTGAGLGNTHIFGRSAVSPRGMEALYAYVQSLSQQ